MAHLSARQFGPAGGGPPRQLVILCHGLGANGADLIPLAPILAEALPHALFLAPDAPEACDLLPPGEDAGARQWFSLRDWRPSVMAEGAQAARGALDHFIDESLAAHGIAPSDYALLGFSQGAMMTLFAGLRRAVPPRAILAYSGILLAPETLAAEIAHRPPVLLAHGERDEVVPAEFSRMAARSLRDLAVPVDLVLAPELGHAIDAVGLSAGSAMLARAFAGG